MQKRLFFLVALMLVVATSVMGQVTTSAMTGRVTLQGSNETVIGATVQAVHTPSGTRYAAVTNVDGIFRVRAILK